MHPSVLLQNIFFSSLDFGERGYVFEPYIKLAEVLSIKATLGVKTCAAYLRGDKEALKALLSDYDTVAVRVAEFHGAFKNRWFADNKPHGFEIRDIRLGGLIMRIRSAQSRLVDYIDGKIPAIPELEEEILPSATQRPAIWRNCVSASIVCHIDNCFA